MELWEKDDTYKKMTDECKAKLPTRRVPFNKGTMLKFLGILIRMSIYGAKNIQDYWGDGVGGVRYGFEQYMAYNVFKNMWRFLRIPGDVRS